MGNSNAQNINSTRNVIPIFYCTRSLFPIHAQFCHAQRCTLKSLDFSCTHRNSGRSWFLNSFEKHISQENFSMASYCKESGNDGKDKIIFVNKEDYSKPINTTIATIEPEEEEGLITKDGDINWACPCLGGMATGPCGQEFREAFSCFHYSTAEMKGSDCVDRFQKMSECMSKYPDLYPDVGNDDDGDGDKNKTEKTSLDQEKPEQASTNQS